MFTVTADCYQIERYIFIWTVMTVKSILQKRLYCLPTNEINNIRVLKVVNFSISRKVAKQ